MKQCGKRPDGFPALPWVRLAPQSAPGPTDETQERLDVLDACGHARPRRLTRVLDDITVRWAVNKLPATLRWTLNTHVLFLRKEREQASKVFDDDEWLAALEGDFNSDVAAQDVEDVGPEQEADDGL